MTSPIRVVIAEDSAILRDGLSQLLVDRGFAVTNAVSEPEALKDSVEHDCPDVAIIEIGVNDIGAGTLHRHRPRHGCVGIQK